jgi:hypothetical protein
MHKNDLTNTAAYASPGLMEYLLAVLPDNEAGKEISEEKNSFISNYGLPQGAETRPFIPIINFLSKEVMEGTLIRWIQNSCNLHSSFEVCFNNYSGFPPHTIYLRIQDPKPFMQLATRLRIIDGFIQANDCPPVSVISKPFLSLAGKLPEHVYRKAVGDYAQKTFHASFLAEKLVLMKRSWEGEKYILVNTFNLATTIINN